VIASAWAAFGFTFILLLFVVLGLAPLAMLVVALVDIVKRPDWQWRLSGQEKVLWLLLVILVNVLAIPSLIYWFRIRPKLMAVEQAAAAGQLGPGQVTYSGWEPIFTPSFHPGVAAAGWYPDPSGGSQFRWWDGTRWTEHTWSQPRSD
jgi:Protein of unknown function (DUF2510)